ncbi:MerR family transcriptional regulator [Clostridium sp. D2Q-14]|uniref:MerR family transcriptional regulator n=1 Tax=Anaeromonas gelatinilytica TaxID=2683194 RepID=UPI00193BF0A4|nr:MerR family transcriptional regulator [Anaeromonas gelatinilytica]MBS4534165.1 MerR family transcriptional regulator [Anaeromonas gelatinilytica]
MEYTIKKLANIAGISSRTLRYYDEIAILKPVRINSSGYRIYSEKEVDKLQQILFYKELGVELKIIKSIIDSPGFDELKALKEHHDKLLNNKKRLEILIRNVKKTIDYKKRRIKMSDKEKFEGFKEKLVYNNEEKYGKEVRGKYGDDVVDKSNKKLEKMTQEEYDRVTTLEKEFIEKLKKAFESDDPKSELAQKAVDLHRQWLSFFWDDYSKEAHAGLAQMYIDDEKFRLYYDKEKPGMAKFLRDAVFVYMQIK